VNPWSVLIPVIVIVVVALIVVAATISVRHERRRRAALRQWAAHHGWTYAERPRPDWARRLPGQDRRGVELMLSGPLHGYHVSVADYTYVTTSTSMTDSHGTSSTSRTYHRLVVVAVRLPWAAPAVGVAPRHALSRLGRAVFGEGATAIGNADFDKAFKVSTKDPVAARRLVGPALVAEHLAGRVPAWSLNGADLLTYHRGRVPDPAGIADLAGPLVRVAALLGR
jgi:hypothetical protein